MKEKYKKELLIFFIGITFYFTLGLLYSYYLGIYKYWNVLFDIDTPRVFGDLTLLHYNHYRAVVHPLFIFFFQPIYRITNIVLNDSPLSCVLMQSFFASLSLVCFYKILNKFKIKNNLSIILLVAFGTSFGQIVFSSSIETYIFAQSLLLLMWLFSSYKIDSTFNFLDYILIVLLGIGSLSVTITNFFQFLIMLFFTFTLNKKNNNRILKSFIIVFCVIAISVFFANIQNIIWPSAPNFFTKNLSDFISKNSEETLYMSNTIGVSNFINVINSMFSHSLNLSNIYFLKTGSFLFFKNSIITNIVSIFLMFIFCVINIFYIAKTKLNIKNNKFYYALLLSLIFNFVLHLVYGNGSAFLYVCHYNFLIFLIVAYILSKFEIKFFENKFITLIFVFSIFLNALRIIIYMFIVLYPRFNPLVYFRLLPVIILIIFCTVVILLLFKNKIFKVLCVIIVSLVFIFCRNIINNVNEKIECSDGLCILETSLKEYNKQLKELKNEFMVESYIDRDEPIGIMYFGLADRRKMVYKQGKIIDGKTQKIIKEFDYDEEFIIPNEYTVILKKDNDIYKIVENEKGVFLCINDNVEELSTGKYKIVLPEFDGYKYSEVLKVLHQEILFNIDGSEPKPNIFGYKQAYYRDAMLVTMALENTNNVSILSDWVLGLNKIYDNSRADDIDETDNLGELLYIIGATGVNRSDLVKKIQYEISKLKTKDNMISGMVDGSIQTYYPTLLAIFGGKKLGIDIGLSYPIVDDAYAKLTWYSDYRINTNVEYSMPLYPYLSWGFYHYAGYGKLFMLDEIYPLTYEGGENSDDYKLDKLCFISEFYCERDLYISHIWTASEMFLFLKDFK